MIQIPFEDIITRVKQKTGLSDDEINKKINEKLEQLSGLISKEGAAHIIANELGIKLFETSGKLKISNILIGMRNVETVGKIQQVFSVNEFETRSGAKSKVGSFIIGDETGTIRTVAWGSQADNLVNLKQDLIIMIKGGYVRNNQGRKEIHLNDKSRLIISPKGETIKEIGQTKANRKSIKDLNENDNVEIMGTVVQIFNPNFFSVCPECGKKLRQTENTSLCAVHGNVTPQNSYVINFFIDDGTENIRAVCFRKNVEELLEKNPEEILVCKEDPSKFDEIKDEMMGKQKKLSGRVTRNTLFNRLEFMVDNISEANPEEELNKLKCS